MEYISILKKISIGILIIVSIFFAFKLTIFYIPFLIAYLISVLMEPLIKILNKKTSLSRKACSILVLITTFSIVIGVLVMIIIKLINETTTLLQGLNTYLEKILNFFSLENLKLEKFKISSDVLNFFESSTTEYLNMITSYLKNFLNNVLNYITSIPKMFINFIITILATYFITSDKIYILDRMEYHLSKKMVYKITKHVREITSSIGGYLKAELILCVINFAIVLTGLNIFYLVGFDIEYPILMALIIGFVDALPILGAGTIMIPWCIFLFINSNISLALAILGLYIFITVLKQILEPKFVSSSLGIHPIFTLIAMYTGFRLLGILGLLIGPIVIIILKNIFSETIEKGIINSILDD